VSGDVATVLLRRTEGVEMSDGTSDEKSGSWDVTQASEQAWTDFEKRLEEYVAAMAPTSWVRFTVPVAHQPEDGCVPWVRVDAGEDRIEVTVPRNRELAAAHELALPQQQLLVSWDFLRPNTIDPIEPERRRHRGWTLVERDPICAEIPASATVGVLREIFGVLDPALLEVDGSEDEAWRTLVSVAPAEDDDRPQLPIAHPADQAELRDLIGAVLAEWPDTVGVDDDGDHRFVHDGLTVYVRALPHEPTVEIFARLAQGVRSRPQTAIELALVNRDHGKVKFQLFDRDVYQLIALPAMPFVGEHLWSALEEFIAAVDRVRADLTLRTGGRG
jgi:hypothetical protein